jgi:hypothetical protein
VARQRARVSPVCWLTITTGITSSAEALIRRLARFLTAQGQRETAPLCEPGQVDQPLPRDEQTYLIAAALSRTRALVCLDNVHLLDGEPNTVALTEHLAGTSQGQFLAISREGLHLAGFDPLLLSGLARDQARALIREVSGARLPEQVADRLIYLMRSTLAGLSEPGRRLIGLLAVFRHPWHTFSTRWR